MNVSWLKNRNVQIIIACLAIPLLIYIVDVYHIAYQMTAWKSLGEIPITPTRLLYLNNDTPSAIGYLDKETGEQVTCTEAVAYLESDTGDVYRCCQAERNVSCLKGEYSADIPTADPTCTNYLVLTFGVPATLPNAKDYLLYGDCPDGGDPQLTVAQLNANGQVQWKSLKVLLLGMVNNALRCILAPLLVALAARTFFLMRAQQNPDRQIRRW